MARRVVCSLVAALIAILSVEATAYEHSGAVTRSAIASPILEKTFKL